jgi:hypothetical protein
MAGIVHGTYHTESESGFVADFCPVCRDIETFNVIRVGDASHIAFVSLGKGQLAGYMIRCGKCGVSRPFTRERYATIAQQCTGKDDLVAMTFPNIRTEWAKRLELEARLRKDPSQLSPVEREQLLMEPFDELDPEIEHLDKGTVHQKQASMWGMLALCTVVGAGGAFVRFQDEKMPWVMGAAIAAFITVWAGILIVVEKRGMGKRIMPSLTRALKPLRPSKGEIEAIINRCRKEGLWSGKKVNPNHLWNLLQACGDRAD